MTQLPGILPEHAPAERARPDVGQEPGGGGCDKAIDVNSTIKNNRVVAALDTGICTNADIDVYTSAGGSGTFVVQGGADDAAWTHTDVSDPANPVIVGQFTWSGGTGKATTTPDVKAFHQGSNDFIALALERTKVSGTCGVVIVEVNDPANPVIRSQFIGNNWCDTHNVFVENDANGDGAWVYATADTTADLRVLAISDSAYVGSSVDNPVEVGRYARTDRNPASDSDTFNDTYVHDVTVVDGTVYASYWLAGLDIFDASIIRQQNVQGLFADETNPAVETIAPAPFDGTPFLVHHAYPSADGSLVFVEDEITFEPGFEPVRMFETGTGLKRDGLRLEDSFGTGDTPVAPAHNLAMSSLTPNRLYVGWYKLGLQAWDFDPDPTVQMFLTDPADEPRTASVYHQAQTEADDEDYSGAWGIRLAELGDPANIYAFQSDRNFGLIVNCLGDGNGALGNCPPSL